MFRIWLAGFIDRLRAHMKSSYCTVLPSADKFWYLARSESVMSTWRISY